MESLLLVLVVFATGALIYGLTMAITPAMRRRMTEEERRRAKLSPEHENRLVGIVIAVSCVIAVPLVVFDQPAVKLIAMLTVGVVSGAISVLYVRRHGRDERG